MNFTQLTKQPFWYIIGHIILPKADTVGDRLMVGRQFLELPILVRIQVPELKKKRLILVSFSLYCESWIRTVEGNCRLHHPIPTIIQAGGFVLTILISRKER